jgi:CheY-like chemotaxis protein
MKLNTPKPDLIFPDIRVLKKNGLEIAKIIKKDPRLKKVLTIMLTTSSPSSDVLHALNGASADICAGPVQEAALQLE